jgi:DNA-binding transcriptional regulator LsrR (DeoR family)
VDKNSASETADDLKTKIAWLYYIEGKTQEEISKVLNINRLKVLRALAASRQNGTVQIRVTSKLSHCIELECSLEKKYGFERAIVTPKPQDAGATPEIIGATLGSYINEIITENMTIGLGWGRTLSASLPNIAYREQMGISVVSMLGGLTRVSGANPSEFAWRVADRLSAECYLMAAPVFAPDSHTREALIRHPGIKEIFQKSSRIDLAILSVGDLSPVSTISEYYLLQRDELKSLEQAGAIGDVLCRFINAEGQVISHPINDRVIACDPRQLQSARKIVLASGGWEKYNAIRGAIRLLKPHVLVTDEFVAERLCSEAD